MNLEKPKEKPNREEHEIEKDYYQRVNRHMLEKKEENIKVPVGDREGLTIKKEQDLQKLRIADSNAIARQRHETQRKPTSIQSRI
jgi:hypothetical protein